MLATIVPIILISISILFSIIYFCTHQIKEHETQKFNDEIMVKERLRTDLQCWEIIRVIQRGQVYGAMHGPRGCEDGVSLSYGHSCPSG